MRASMSSSVPLLAVALGIVAVGLPGCDFAAQTREGTRIWVFAPGEPVQVSIDGGEAFELTTFTSRGVDPGEHTVSVNGGPPTTVTLEAFDEWIVPTVPDQCFMSLDVAMSHYEIGGSGQRAPEIDDRRQDTAPFEVPLYHSIAKKDLPESRSSGQQVFLLRSAACWTVDDMELGLRGKVTNGEARVEPLADPVARARRKVCKEDKAGWCTTLREWRGAPAGTLPTEPVAHVGMAMPVPTGADDEAMAEVEPSLSILAIDPTSKKLGISWISGEGPEQEAQLEAAVVSTKAMLQGQADKAAVSEALGGYLDGRPAAVDQAFTVADTGWQAEGVSLRKVGERWVAVHSSDSGGTFVSVYGPYTADVAAEEKAAE